MIMSVRTAFLRAALFLAFVGSASADPSTYLARFTGSFSGSGSVLRDVDPSPRSVSCRLSGQSASASVLSIAGTCRAAVIFTRQIDADISLDAGSGTFSGGYTGSETGPAQLSGGRLQGDTLTMTLTYARPTYGDRNATMTIVNSGNGQFMMTVTDEIEGRVVQTSQMTLSQG